MKKHIKADYYDPTTCFFMERYERIEFLKKIDRSIIEEFSYFLDLVFYSENTKIL